MRFTTRFHRTVLLSGITLLVLGCSKTSFIPTGSDVEPPPPRSPCQVAVLKHAPDNDNFTELGMCAVSVPGGSILFDNTPTAVRKLQKCACEHGGNAIILPDDLKAGASTMPKYAERRISAKATVLLVAPKR